ncbi:CgeB family protein [Metapseudomonas otitidis]|uniref:Eps11J n=1 Tax=Metapseudomonas otitidis TaxID=319939 RepID=A0A679GJ98_9GAMM|nr:hypothetical protein [Pseudomonas otitidis]BCA29875.1 hypothetical protein PtoMrB4_38520 [Pseudomonas otitidis]
MSYLLKNKRVLFIAPQFFGYEQEIRAELERRGAKVDFLLDRPFQSAFLKAVTRWRRQWVMGAAERYYEQHIDLSGDYDYVFVINGQTLSERILILWRQRFERAKFFLYMWDSFVNRKDAVSVLGLFDKAFTFDRNDAQKYSINFRPLFFSKGFESASNEFPEWDISFVGTAHTDRYAVVSKVARRVSGVRAYYYLFLQAPWVYWVYRIVNPGFSSARLSDFKFKPLTKADVQQIFISSRAVLDIEHPKQTGLTMRTLETLGARKKLITTNAQVMFYDFYQDSNICVIDRSAPVIPEHFLSTPYVDISPEIYQRYRLEGWLDEIFDGELA